MDVFGTVVSTIDLVSKIVGYLQAVKGAKEDRLRLLSEVSGLRALLDILHHRLEHSGADGNDANISIMLVKAGIGSSLDQCYRALRSTVEELERIVSPVVAGGSFSFAEKMKDIRWPFRQKDITSMLGQIERLKSLISLTFQASLMEFIEEARDELAVVGLNVEGIRSAISSLEADQRAHMKKTEMLQTSLQALGFTLHDSANSIARIENTVAVLDRNQQDQMTKGSRMQADLTIIKEGQELKDILQWLSPLDFSEKHNTAFEKHAPGTGAWFLEHPKFVAWRRGEYNTLWCPGHPGVGKSVMASLVIHELGRGTPVDTALLFIYFEFKIQYTITQLAETILKQLVQRRVTRSGLESLRKFKAGNRPTSNELFTMLKAEVESYARVFVVVDALDETTAHIWVPLMKHLRTLSGISLLATSRDLGDIAAEFQEDRRLDVMADEGDLKRYIEGRLSSSTGGFQRLLEADPSLHGDIVSGIMEKADGMFLLAQLHMNSLRAKARAADLRRALVKLPGDLDATYDEAMKRISSEHRALAYQIISWLIHAAQPMTIHDLQYALAVEDGVTAVDTCDLYDEASLTSVCVGLVVLREDTAGSEPKHARIHSRTNGEVVGLVHYTTQEYFLRNCKFSTQLADSPYFAITCLRYLSFEIFNTDGPPDEGVQKRLLEIPFAEYAISSWGKHAHQHYNDTTVRALAMEVLHDKQKVAMLGSISCRAKGASAIQICAHFGLEDYLEYLLDNGFDLNSEDSDGDTTVTQAAIDSQEEIVRVLLARKGVNVNPKGWNGTTPLTRAIMAGHQGIVELLLARDDVDANSRDNDGKTPIAHAVCYGHESIVELLLARNDIDVNSRDDNGRTLVTHAAGYGHGGIVELLLARDDADVNSRDKDGYTPLSTAVAWGHENVVQLLLARNDLNVNSCDNAGQTAIAHAAKYGQDSIATLLLERANVDVNSQDVDGNTPLALAITWMRARIVQLLLGRDDLDVNLKNHGGLTPLAIAAYYGDEESIEFLLAKTSTEVNARGLSGEVPLSYAAGWGHSTIVRLLLAWDDIEVNAVDSDGNTPLDHAETRGYHAVVELLQAAGGRTGIELESASRQGLAKEAQPYN